MGKLVSLTDKLIIFFIGSLMFSWIFVTLIKFIIRGMLLKKGFSESEVKLFFRHYHIDKWGWC